MSDSPAVWPIPNKPVGNDRVILASQGIRIWTTECRLESFGETLHLSCSDPMTVENLRRQQRVAFTILNSTGTVQGSGMARVADTSGSSRTKILLEPYRISTGQETYELRLNGWTKVDAPVLPDMSRYAFWYKAFRLVSLPLSVLPVLVGGAAAFALGQINLLLLALTLIGVVCAHAGANAANDYFDFRNGVDSSRALSSFLGALSRECVEPEMILLAAFGCFIVTALIGLVLVLTVGWELLLFGLVGLLGAFFYTGRPISYKYHALGELMIGILMGPVIVMGAFYVETRGWDWGVFLISGALGMLIASIVLVNNLRDMPDDRAAGIRTLPMLLGVSRTKILYYLLTWGIYPALAGAILIEHAFWPLVLSLLSLSHAVKAVKVLRSTKNDINEIREKSLSNPYPLLSIRLHARFGTLVTAGLAVAGIIRMIVG